MMADVMEDGTQAPGPIAFTGSVKRAQQWCRDSGYFFNAPAK
jgi:hypothetical protein